MEDVEGALSSDFEGGLETGAAAGGSSALGSDGTSSVQTPAEPLPAVPNSNVRQEVSKMNFRQRVCRHWLLGNCLRGDDCRFLHEYDNARMPICRFLVKLGECREPDCIFKHNSDDITTVPKAMTEMDQHGEMSPSHLDDGSEEQQQSYYCESKDIASLQDNWPSFSQTASHALETPTSKAKAENVSEKNNNRKIGLESADTSKLSDEAANQQNCGQATQRHESGGSSGERGKSKWDPMLEEGGVANEGECSGKRKRSRSAAEEQKISLLGDGQRSPSPEPQYNNLGIRINRRQVRAREKLMQKRQMTIARLIQKNLAFRPPADSKSFKRQKGAQLKELAKIKDIRKLRQLCRQQGHEHSTINSPTKVSLPGAKVDITNHHDLCFEHETGRSAVSIEDSGSGTPRQSIQPLGTTDNYMSWLAQAGGLEHPQNGNARMEPDLMRVSTEKRGSGLPIQSSQPLAFTDNYMSRLAGSLEHPENGIAGIVPGKVSLEKNGSGLRGQSTQQLGLTDTYISWLAGGKEHAENVNAGMGPERRKVSIEKSGSGLPRRSTHSMGLTDNYMSWLTGGLQRPESGKDEIGTEIRKAYLEKSGSGLPRQSSQPLGLRDSYMSWLDEGLVHTSDGSAGIGPDIRKGGGFGTSSTQGTRPYVYSSYSSHVGVESSFDGPSFSHMGLGPPFKHSHGKETDHSNVYVGCLPPTMEEEQLIKLFSSFGRIVEAKVIRNHVNGSSKGYGFVKFDDIHCAVQATAHMNGYSLGGKTLAVRVVGRLPSGSGLGPAEGLYAFDKQPPRLPVRSGAYAQPSWSAPIRSESSVPYNPYSDNNGSGIISHSVSPLQRDTFNSLPATSYCTYGPYQIPLHSVETSIGMQGPPKSQLVLGNVHDSLMSKLNIHSAAAMTHFSPNQAGITTYQRYAHPSIPSDSACFESPLRGSLMGGLVTPPQSSSLFSSGYQKKAMELEYEKFLAEMGP